MSSSQASSSTVPFFRVSLGEDEIAEVVECLRSGWLTTGPRVREFEQIMAQAVAGKHAVALNSCTAALHLACEALGLARGQAVLVPTMTFAATAEIVQYCGATPVLVDCDPVTLNLELNDARRKLDELRSGRLLGGRRPECVGIIPVHVAGYMLPMHEVNEWAVESGLWVVEDAAHAFPAAYRKSPDGPWQRSGENSAAVTCFSFYANKTITTGEGGMAITDDERLAERIRQMSLHGLSGDAWKRYSGGAKWDYRILAPGYKYNLTDIAAALGIHQARRGEQMRRQREELAVRYCERLAEVGELELPPDSTDRLHSWHLFPVRLRLDRLTIDRNEFIEQLRGRGVGCSVHWRPLHLHPLYSDGFGWRAEQLPAASDVWPRLVTLPLFQGMRIEEQDRVIEAVAEICRTNSRRSVAGGVSIESNVSC